MGPSKLTDDFPDGVSILHDSSDDEAILFEDDDEPDYPPAPPRHPMPSMQGPFEESIVEAENPNKQNGQESSDTSLGPKARRQKLVDGTDYNTSYNSRWRQSSGAKFHPLAKIVAQAAFGIHLLHKRLAKSDAEVVRILERHVAELDAFLRTTEEDFDLATMDISTRIDYLKLPLEHVNIFDAMLNDRQFRSSIIDGNEKIEKIVHRTANLMNDLLVDVRIGADATREMEAYLNSIDGKWPRTSSTKEVYDTMLSNTSGWLECFETLQMKGNSLGVALVKLETTLNEMSKRVGVASRKSIAMKGGSSIGSMTPSSQRSRSSSSSRRVRAGPSTSSLKPLPEDPDLIADAVQSTMPKLRDHLTQLSEQKFNACLAPVIPKRTVSIIEPRIDLHHHPSNRSISTGAGAAIQSREHPKPKTPETSTPVVEPLTPSGKAKRRPSKLQKKSLSILQSPLKVSKPDTERTSKDNSNSTDQLPKSLAVDGAMYPKRNSSLNPAKARDSAHSSLASPKDDPAQGVKPAPSEPTVSSHSKAPSRKLNLFPSTAPSMASTRGQSELSLPMTEATSESRGAQRRPSKLRAEILGHPASRRTASLGAIKKLFGKRSRADPQVPS